MNNEVANDLSQSAVSVDSPFDRAAIALCAAVFILVLGTGLVAPVLASYAQGLGATGVLVGLLFSGFYVVRLVAAAPIGGFGQAKGPRAILIVSLTLYPFIAAAYFFASEYITLLAARLLHGLASAMMLPMAMAYMGTISARGKEGRYMGAYNTVQYLASGLGPLAGGLLTASYGPRSVFGALGLLAIAALLVARFALPRESLTASAGDTAGGQCPENGRVFGHPGVMSIAILNVAAAILAIFLVSFFTIYAKERGYGDSQIGLLVAIVNIAMGSTQFFFGWLSDRVNKGAMIGGGGIAVVLILAVAPFVTNFSTLCLVMGLIGLAGAMASAASSALAAQVGREVGMARSMSFLGSATSFGMVVGPLASGWLADRFGAASTFAFTAAAWLAATVTYVVLWSLMSARARRTAI